MVTDRVFQRFILLVFVGLVARAESLAAQVEEKASTNAE